MKMEPGRRQRINSRHSGSALTTSLSSPGKRGKNRQRETPHEEAIGQFVDHYANRVRDTKRDNFGGLQMLLFAISVLAELNNGPNLEGHRISSLA
jgi:hypothetical protein